MKGDFHVRFCGKIGAKFPCLTRLGASVGRHTADKKTTN